MNFNDFDDEAIVTMAEENVFGDTLTEAIETAIVEAVKASLSALELVELFAAEQGLIESEQELSDKFDEEHEDWLNEHRDDSVMISEAFNNWTDSLCKFHEIHDEQYHHYCYVGKYSD